MKQDTLLMYNVNLPLHKSWTSYELLGLAPTTRAEQADASVRALAHVDIARRFRHLSSFKLFSELAALRSWGWHSII